MTIQGPGWRQVIGNVHELRDHRRRRAAELTGVAAAGDADGSARTVSYHAPARCRCIAGLSGFFTLIQIRDRPDRYGAAAQKSRTPELPTLVVSSCG
jgi:hypothetical protein